MTTKFWKEKTFLRTNKMSEFGKSMRIWLPITDENEIRIKLAETEKLLKTDYLTWVCNREALLNNLHILFTHQERDKPTNFTISIIDIDNFKTVNDIYWHKIWDQVLQKFAHHLMTSIREWDKVYRIWWDEFIIIFQDTDSESITNKLTHIRESFYKNPIDIDWEKLNIWSSWWLKTINIRDYRNDNLNDTNYSEELFSKIQEKIDCYMYSVKYYKLIKDQLLEDWRITRHSSEKNGIAIELNKNSEFSWVKVVNSEWEFVISVNELLRIKELKKEMAESKNWNMRK
jgi:diguanylate cyclase (GGDEF)-like protein